MEECESNPCEHNSTCIDLGAEYECNCTAGYEGVICDIGIRA